MIFDIKINTRPDTIESIPIGHLFTVENRWPIYLKSHTGITIVGYKKFQYVDDYKIWLATKDKYVAAINDKEIDWTSKTPIMIQGS